jgi:regulator of sigma E protease
VKITGMNPREELAPEVAPRAYFRQPVWKRIVVILAGPAMNVLTAFLIVWVLFMVHGVLGPPTNRVAGTGLRPPASTALRGGDWIVSVDGRRGGSGVIRAEIARHRCPGRQTDGCAAAAPARVVVRRQGRYLAFDLRPRYRAAERRALLGFTFAPSLGRQPPARAAALGAGFLWFVTSRTVSAMVRIFDPGQRKQLSGVVGTSQYLHQQFTFDLARAMLLLAIISMSLAIVNLFPFLPLDGGHIFWAVAEKLRGRAIPFQVMERSMAIGFVLVLTLFVIGLTNDIGRLQGQGLRPR